MLYQNLLISNSVSDYPNIISSDLWYIYECARISKMKFLYVDYISGKMYGIADEAFGIHEMNLPFLNNTDLLLYAPILDKDIIKKYEQFFIPIEFNWAIIPVYYWDMYKAGDIEVNFDISIPRAVLIDKTTKLPIECIYMRNMDQEIQFHMFITVIDRFFMRKSRWINPIYIKNFHTNPSIINGFFEQKTTFGSFIINIYRDDLKRNIPLTFFKGMIPLNKSDTMDAELYIDSYKKGDYMLVLYPKKKKDPIIGNKYGVPFSDVAYYCYTDLI